MPRKSAAAMTTPIAKQPSTLLQAPASLSQEERQVFVDLVLANKPQHFMPSDMPLLVTYCEVICQLRLASKELKKGIVAGGKTNPWIGVQERLIKSMVALSMRLRLSPQARSPTNPSRASRQANAYEEMRSNGYFETETETTEQ